MLKLLLILPVVSGIMASCAQDEPDEISAEKERLILIYAVAANDLQSNLGYDLKEILYCAKDLNLKCNKVLVYSVVNSGECVLQELQKTSRGYEFVTVMDFDELPLSTSEERIREVLEYVVINYEYPHKGLVLWSHATGWLPWFEGSTPGEERRKSFGMDNYENHTYKTNITSLARAIPENVFDFIWFDCCYMGNIETVYQLRNKTDYIIGSVLEIASDGMPYQLTMPLLLQKEAKIKEAAYQFFSYYDRIGTPVSVSIMKTDQLDQLASATANVISNGIPPTTQELSVIQTYQRKLDEKCYDMGQLVRSYSNLPSEYLNAFNKAMDKVVIYKLISYLDFNNRPIQVGEYSGMSMHFYKDTNSENETFYRELDWYKATREPQIYSKTE